MLVTALASNALKAQQSHHSSPDAPAYSRPAPQTNGAPCSMLSSTCQA